jgi:DUF1009 family protein
MSRSIKAEDARPALAPIALYWGHGKYPRDLYEELLRTKNYDVFVFSHRLRIPAAIEDKRYHRVRNLSELIRKLNENKVNRIIFAGGFNLSALHILLPLIIFNFLLDRKTCRSLQDAGFFAKAGSHKRFSGRIFLKTIAEILEEAQITLVSPHDLTNRYKGEDGTHGAGNNPWLPDIYLPRIRESLTKLDMDVTFGVAQALIAVNGEVKMVERGGTKRLLLQFRRRRKSFVSAGTHSVELVKLPARGFNSNIDLPFIGPDTIRQCARAGISGIYFCHNDTILFDKAHTDALAKQNNVYLTGFSRSDLEPRCKALTS